MLSIARRRKRSRNRQPEANRYVVLVCTETDGTQCYSAYAQIVALLPEFCLAVMRCDEKYTRDHTGEAQTPAQNLRCVSGGLKCSSSAARTKLQCFATTLKVAS